MAEANLSQEQRKQLEQRQNSVRIMDDDEESHGEDAPSQKGKRLDPRNWGDVILNSDEYNPDVQTQILASISEMKETRRDSQEHHSHLQEMIEEFQTWQRQSETERIEAKYEAKIEELMKVYTTKATAPAEDLGLQDHCSSTAEPDSTVASQPPLGTNSNY
ncbi:hypothetical protein GGU10DRAFT_337561 [Lentinula aff. detonsa]|uniref:Uncharacterized protein n=1 Tax=Lentinula aff. detonsa TaxID=2804958 RepID=A0AA38KW79_9AGAR|nr:hypothetical protein GGU10DRAFT_337561 [Lentinula aff. detonsa]